MNCDSWRMYIGRLLMRLGRRVLYRKQNRYCWICGAAAGMGPFWAGAITCWECYDKWHSYHEPAKGWVVDPGGLGRFVGIPTAAEAAEGGE